MLYRAFYALPNSIKGADGQPVNALLGTANLILREVEAHSPRAVALCFGPDAAAYRVELFAGYHADRPEMPEELVPQWAAAKPFFEAFGWTVAVHASLEADDLLGTYAQLETKAGGRALLLTGDRDMFQCASDSVTVLYVSTGGARGADEVGPREVEKRYGIPPELGRRAPARARLAGGRARRGDPDSEAEAPHDAHGLGRRTAGLQGHGDPAGRGREAAEEQTDRLGGRGEGRRGSGDEPAREAPHRAGGLASPE